MFHKSKTLEVGNGKEFHFFLQNHIWDLVKLPFGKTIVKCKLVFKLKPNVDGVIQCYKTQLVVKGCFQIFLKKSLKLNLLWFILRAYLHYFLHHNNWKYGSHVQFDMKIKFIHSAIDKNNYMVQALKFENQRFLQHVYHFKKSIYGLHQASHLESQISQVFYHK
jgi:hypothetical protein